MSSDQRLAKRIVATALCALAAGVCSSNAVSAQTTKLDPFVGRDLKEQRPSQDELRYLNALTGEVPNLIGPAPWRVWRTMRDGRLRYIVLLGEDVSISPGGPSACIQLFNASMKRVASWSFLAGWRASIDRASLIYSSGLARDLIVLHVVGFEGRAVVNEYFAISDDRLRLVRLENEKGELIAKDYFYGSEIGVMPEAKTVDDWVHLLESKDEADVLSALVFLSGIHFGPGTSAGKYSVLIQKLFGTAQIREMIERLAKSENEWVRQASALAASDPRDRVF